MDASVVPGTGHPRRWAILGGLVISLLVVVLDNTVLNVALRTPADPERALCASQSQLEWSINSYTLVFAGLLFTAGIMADRFGRRITLTIGLALSIALMGIAANFVAKLLHKFPWISYAGLLIGPVVVGAVASAAGLRSAIVMLAAVAVIAAAFASSGAGGLRSVKPPR